MSIDDYCVDEAVNRVRAAELANASRIPYRHFTTIDYWQRYLESHPEFQGHSTGSILQVTGGRKFYDAAARWLASVPESDRAEYGSQLFPRKNRSFRHLKTEEQWAAFAAEKGYAGQAVSEFTADSEGNAFYQSLLRWTKRYEKAERTQVMDRIFCREATYPSTAQGWRELYLQQHAGTSNTAMRKTNEGKAFLSGLYRWLRQMPDTKIRADIRQRVINGKRTDRAGYALDDWCREYEQLTGVEGASLGELQRRGKKAAAFYVGLAKWAKYQVNGNAAEARHLMEKVVPSRKKSWTATSIDEWKSIYEGDRRFSGKQVAELLKIPGGNSFYLAFSRWTKEATKDSHERDRLLREVFKIDSTRQFYDFGQGQIKFDSHQERVAAIALHLLGFMQSYTAGQNLHVPTKDQRCTIDFLVGDALVEYHPLSRADFKAGRSIGDAVRRKKSHILQSEHKEREFIHFATLDDLPRVVDALKRQPAYQHLSGLSAETVNAAVRKAQKLAKRHDKMTKKR